MIQQVLHKQLVLDVLDQMRAQAAAFDTGGRRGRRGGPLDGTTAEERAEILASIDIAKKFAPAPDRRGRAEVLSLADRNTWIPQSPEISNVQSAIEEYFLTKRPDAVETPNKGDRRGGTAPMAGSQLKIWREYLTDRRVLGAFEETDIGWINSLFAQGIRKFRKKHPFVPRPIRQDAIPFGDENVRMIVFGDWGSGIPRAQDVADWISSTLAEDAVKDWQKYVIHLGDVYYSGWKSEYLNRFLNYWPVKSADKDKIGSFNLNGNHDMYSGGWDYYDVSLADDRFAQWQGKSSLFHMANSHWQLFGLDTSHEDGDLRGDQTEWVCRSARKELKTMLLSHHQCCSSYETAPKKVIDAIQPVLKQLNVVSWIWGHEHRFMTYENVPMIKFPRCVGHGGVPVYQLHAPEKEIPSPGAWEFRDFDGTGIEHWAKFGYAVLDFQREKIFVRYIDESGVEVRKETME